MCEAVSNIGQFSMGSVSANSRVQEYCCPQETVHSGFTVVFIPHFGGNVTHMGSKEYRSNNSVCLSVCVCVYMHVCSPEICKSMTWYTMEPL